MTEPSSPSASLYRQLGGHEPLAATVDIFSRRMAADDELAPLIAGEDPEVMRRIQFTFLREALCGRCTSRMPSTGPSHATGRITGRQFHLILDHLAAALAACGVPEALGAEVLEQVAALHHQIVKEHEAVEAPSKACS